jgi:hypothetical protein
MARIEEHVEIAASPSVVFQFCHDLARRGEWDERMVRAELLTGEPVRRGTLLRIDAGRAGKYLFSWDAEYTEYQFPSNSTLKVLDAAPSSPFGAGGTEAWQFSRTGSGTQFSVCWDYKPRGFLNRLADALGQRASNRRAIRRSLANLKKLIESGRR